MKSKERGYYRNPALTLQHVDLRSVMCFESCTVLFSIFLKELFGNAYCIHDFCKHSSHLCSWTSCSFTQHIFLEIFFSPHIIMNSRTWADETKICQPTDFFYCCRGMFFQFLLWFLVLKRLINAWRVPVWFFFFALFLKWSFFIHMNMIIWSLLEFSLNIIKVSNERETVSLGFLSFFNPWLLQSVSAHCVASQWDSTNSSSYSDKELPAHRTESYISCQLWHKSTWFSKVRSIFFSLFFF